MLEQAPGAGDADAPRTSDVRHPPAEITICPGGPLLVRGNVKLLDGAGGRIGQRHPTLALCRCGATATKPFCDGSHKLTRFERQDRKPLKP